MRKDRQPASQDNEDTLTSQPTVDSPSDREVEDITESDLTPPVMDEKDISQQPNTTMAVRRPDSARNHKWAGHLRKTRKRGGTCQPQTSELRQGDM